MPTAPPRLASAARNSALSALIAQRAVTEARKVRSGGTAAVAAVVVSHQVANAQTSDAAVAQMLVEQQIDVAAEALLNLLAFTTDTQSLDGMLSAVATDFEFDRLVESIVQDAGRAAEAVAVAVRHDIYHVRFVNLPCCSRCAVLAGRVYRWSDGFQRHPQCFPAGVVTSGPAALGATRRWYEGELVILRTAGGEQLPATANHPVLTDQGWVPANLLQVGDRVIRSTRPEGALPLVIPDEQQAPSLIEDVRGAHGMVPLGTVPTAAEDFHGDGGQGKVDVVLADRFLRYGINPPSMQFAHKEQFARRVAKTLAFAARGAGEQLLLGVRHASDGLVSTGGLSGTLLGGHAPGAHLPGVGHASQIDASAEKVPTNHAATYSVALAERVLALAGSVRRRDVDSRQAVDFPRWDAPAGSLSAENRDAYASRGLDLGHRLAGQVEADRLVEVRRVGWSGHVYNLTSAEGWFSANGLIVSNCDCTMIPTALASPYRQNPDDLVREGHVTGMSKADLQALADGADLNRVVNVRRKAAGLYEAGQALSRGGKPTPAGIYRLAGEDRAKALELLKAAGYIH